MVGGEGVCFIEGGNSWRLWRNGGSALGFGKEAIITSGSRLRDLVRPFDAPQRFPSCTASILLEPSLFMFPILFALVTVLGCCNFFASHAYLSASACDLADYHFPTLTPNFSSPAIGECTIPGKATLHN